VEGNEKANVATLERTWYKHMKVKHLRSAVRIYAVLCRGRGGGGCACEAQIHAAIKSPINRVGTKMRETEEVRQSKESNTKRKESGEKTGKPC
jgi:hypothetical protein